MYIDRVELIPIDAKAIDNGTVMFALHPMAALSPSLQVTCFREQGYLLEIRDPRGICIWQILLNGEGALDPKFGRDTDGD